MEIQQASQIAIGIGDKNPNQDMDLIEVLWRQDIDLGVSREAFDRSLQKELEKERELELHKQREKEKQQLEHLKLEEEKSELTQEPPQNVTYIVDGETGEQIAVPLGSNVEAEQQQAEQTLVDLLPQVDVDNDLSVGEAMRILEEQTRCSALDNITDFDNATSAELQRQLQAIAENISQPAHNDSLLLQQNLQETSSHSNTINMQLQSNLQTDLSQSGVNTNLQQELQMVRMQPQVERLQLQSNLQTLNTTPQFGNMTHLQSEMQSQALTNMTLNNSIVGVQVDVQPQYTTLQTNISNNELQQPHMQPDAPVIPTDNGLFPQEPFSFLRQDSFEPRWQNLNSTLHFMEDEAISPDVEMADVSSNVLMQNVSLVQTQNHTQEPFFFNGFTNASRGSISDGQHLLPETMLPLQTQNSSMPQLAESSLFDMGSPSYPLPNVSSGQPMETFNSTSLLHSLLGDDLDVGQLPGTTLIDREEGLDDNISTDSAVSSMGTSSSPVPDLQDRESEVTSPFEGLEGAAGGGDDCSSVSSKCDIKYEDKTLTDYRWGAVSEASHQLSTNQSMSSNDTDLGFTDADPRHVQHNHTYPLRPGQQPRERKITESSKDRGVDSRDVKRAKEMKVPFSCEDIINIPVEEFNAMLQRYDLSESQLHLIRDIRRRGKNKVAAHNCRARKLEVVSSFEVEIDDLRLEKEKLREEQKMLERQKQEMKHNMDHLYNEVFQSLRDNNGHPYDPAQYSLQQTADGDVFLVPRNDTASTHTEQPRRKRKSPSKKRN